MCKFWFLSEIQLRAALHNSHQYPSRSARACFHEKGSFKNRAAVTVVHMGARKVITVASESERYWRE